MRDFIKKYHLHILGIAMLISGTIFIWKLPEAIKKENERKAKQFIELLHNIHEEKCSGCDCSFWKTGDDPAG